MQRTAATVGTLMSLAACTGTMGVESTDRLGFDPSDLTPPRIRILSPLPGSYVEGGTVTITGHVEDDESEPTVSYDGASVRVGADGSFMWTGPVGPGAHRFRFEAKDRGDHVATAW